VMRGAVEQSVVVMLWGVTGFPAGFGSPRRSDQPGPGGDDEDGGGGGVVVEEEEEEEEEVLHVTGGRC
jgi:hypothetical protein